VTPTPGRHRATRFVACALILALEEVVGDGFEGRGVLPEGLERRARAGGEAVGFLFGLVEAEERGVGRLLRGDVLAGAFAELFGGLGDVELAMSAAVLFSWM
jgi:hypothetical protein